MITEAIHRNKTYFRLKRNQLIFFNLYHGAFEQLVCPCRRAFARLFSKNANARGSAQGGEGGHCWKWLMHYLQQHDQFLALKVSRNHSQNSATRNNLLRTSDVFSSAEHPTSTAWVCKNASNLSTNLKNFLEMLVSGSEKSCEGPCGPRQISNCSLQIQQRAYM